ncbi:hypothetical protein CCP3SC1_2550001 [Gammaproteobacteria bacterium]
MGATSLVVSQNGNVGIGTTAPTYPLDINSSDNNSGGHIALRNANAAPYWGIIKRGSAFASSENLVFSYNNGAGGWTESIDIKKNGNVGIGMTYPAYPSTSTAPLTRLALSEAAAG